MLVMLRILLLLMLLFGFVLPPSEKLSPPGPQVDIPPVAEALPPYDCGLLPPEYCVQTHSGSNNRASINYFIQIDREAGILSDRRLANCQPMICGHIGSIKTLIQTVRMYNKQSNRFGIKMALINHPSPSVQYYIMSPSRMLLCLVVFCHLFLLTECLLPIGVNPISPAQLTKAKLTSYEFSFQLGQAVADGATIDVGFPAEFNYTILASQIECYHRSNGSWRIYPCELQSKMVVVRVGALTAGQNFISIDNVLNPAIYNMSSMFSVCSKRNNVSVECNEYFGKVVFSDAPRISALNPLIVPLSSLTVGQGSSYQFIINFDLTYPENSTIRVTFPQGYTSNNPICKVTGIFNQYSLTRVRANNRSVECLNIGKTIHNENITIVGIYNPLWSDLFGNGNGQFIVEVLQQSSNLVLEERTINQAININPGQIQTNIVPENLFILSNNKYEFRMNLFNSLNSTDYIRIRFPLSWKLFQNQCKILTGFKNQPACFNYTDGAYRYLNVTGFSEALKSEQQNIVVNLTTPGVVVAAPGYEIQITTWNYRGLMDRSTNYVLLNSTIGTIDMLSINAIEAGVKVPAGGTGPLEMTFFLNYNLYQTNVLTNGTLTCSIFPQIPTPPVNVNGIVKCFFFGTVQASRCIYDTSQPDRTTIEIGTPETKDFQYSQIPITITTEGAISPDKIGLTISSMVQRYRFECAFKTHYNDTTPTEVFYSEYIADAIQIPTITGRSMCHQANEWTHVQINLTNPHSLTNTSKEFRFKVEFSRSGWDASLGYSDVEIYRRFPCTLSGTNVQADPFVQCDLYTYKSGPYSTIAQTNPPVPGPYIMVYGFRQTLLNGDQLILELPKLKIGGSGEVASLRFSILEETPAMLEPYVEIFYGNLTLFTSKQPSLVTSTVQTFTPNPPSPDTINSMAAYTFNWNSGVAADGLIYRFDQTQVPTINPTVFTCTTSNRCVAIGYPANWIVEYPAGTAGPTVSTTIPNIIKNARFAGSFSFQALSYLNGEVKRRVTFQVTYTPQTLLLPLFNLDVSETAATIYKGVEHYYQIGFKTVTATNSTNFIRLVFGNNCEVGAMPYCQSSTLLPLDSKGILCIRQSATTLKIYNIQGLLQSTNYDVKVRLVNNQASTSPTIPTVSIYINADISLDPSVTDQALNVPTAVSLSNLYTTPNNFEIKNPRHVKETQMVGYVGPFELEFTPTTTVNPVASLILTLYPHNWNTGFWSTPNNVASDPMVCRVNSQRVPCTWTINPLEFTVDLTTVTISMSSVNVLRLQSEYLTPENGIAYPLHAGNYLTKLRFVDTLAAQTGIVTFYTRVDAQKLFDFHVSSILSDIDTESLFIVTFTVLPTTYPRSYNDPTQYSRIYIEFPTRDRQGNRLFDDALKGYTKTGDFVGCHFSNATNYVKAADITVSPMKCRLIKSETTGEPARVEIINHAAFTAATPSMQIYLGKIWNPATAVKSVEIRIKIEHITNATNIVEEIYEDSFDLFLDPQPKVSPGILANSMDPNTNQFFALNQDVEDINGHIYLTAQSFSVPAAGNYYFVAKLPSYLQVQNNQILPTAFLECSPMNFNWCISMPEINYVVANTLINGSLFKPNLVRNPMSISQFSTFFTCDVWQDRRFVGTITYDISPTRWLQIQGDITMNAVTPVGKIDKLVMNKKDCEIMVDFNTINPINVGGTVEIRFPSIFTGSMLRSHCRSAVAAGSLLYSQGGMYGQLGCHVQGRSWVITGFQAVTGPINIKITGKIDIPNTSGDLDKGEIITYSDMHDTDIYSNGMRIDYYNDAFGLVIPATPAFNAEPEIFMQETLPLRVGYTGPFRIIVKLPSDLQPQNTGSIQLRLSKSSIRGITGGFVYDVSKKVCEFMDLTTNEKLGCIVKENIDDVLLNYENVRYSVTASTTLLSSKKYLLTITSQKGSQPEGILFPTVAGTYKVDMNADYDGSGTYPVHTHSYMQVYGTVFNRLIVTSFVTSPGKENLIWIDLAPTTPVTANHQIVVEFPTKSNDGILLFDNDLGMNYLDYSWVRADVFDCTTYDVGDFMKCSFFLGSQTTGRAAKIVCGSLNLGASTIPLGGKLKFAIKIKNPLVTTQKSLPIIVYTYDPVNHVKTNFNLVDGAIYLQPPTGIVVDRGNYATVGGRLQTKLDQLKLTTRNQLVLNAGDYYVIFMSFPIRNNGKLTGGCRNAAGTSIGNVYYNWHNWAIVCQLTATVAVQAGGSTTTNLLLDGFYTPWYLLTDLERVVVAHASYLKTYGYSVQVNHNDVFPLLQPRIVFPSASSLTMSPIMGHNIGNQQDDYVIQVKLETVATISNDLQYCKMISIEFPLTTVADYVMHNTDCVQETNSQIQVDTCRVDISQRAIYVGIVQKNYTNDRTLRILTRNRAIKNPYNNVSNSNMKDFIVRFYSWENVSYSSANGNSYTYMMMDSSNIQPITMPYALFPTTPTPGTTDPVPTVPINPFFVGMFPHQRYYNEFVPFLSTHYAPLTFDMFFPTTASYPSLSPPNYHTVTVFLGSTFSTFYTTSRIWDLYYNKPVCYLNNNRVKRCTIDSATNSITMEFFFTIPVGVAVNVYVSVLDPRNPDVNGFKFVSGAGVTKIRIETKPNGGSIYTVESPPFDCYQTRPTVQSDPYRAISYGTVRSMHSIANKLNVIEMQLWFNSVSSIVQGLMFEIPLKNEYADTIYGNPDVAFFNLQNGAPYPCGNNQLSSTGRVKCHIEKGDNSRLGAPIRIHMADFAYTTKMRVRLLLNNPDDQKWLSIKVHAYGTTPNTRSIYGQNYLGYYNFMYILRSEASTYTQSSNPNTHFYPEISTRLIQRNNERFVLLRAIPVVATSPPDLSLSILEVPLEDNYGYDENKICQSYFVQSMTTSDDILYLERRNNLTGIVTRKAYYIKTWNAGQTLWYIEFIKCKHFLKPVVAYYAMTDVSVYEVSHSITPGTYINSLYDAAGLVYWEYTSVTGGSAHYIMEFDLTSMITTSVNFAFVAGSDYYLRVTIAGVFWTASSFCEISGGATNSYGQKPLCSWLSSSVMLIRMFDDMPIDQKISRRRLKIMFTSSSFTVGTYSVSGTLQLFANQDAYNNAQDVIFTLTTNSLTRTVYSVYYGTPTALHPSSMSHGDSGAVLTVNTITSTSSSLYMQIEYTPSYTYSLNDDYYNFFFTFNIYNFNIPSWTSISATITYPNGNQETSAGNCFQYLSQNSFRYNSNAGLCSRYFSTYSGMWSWGGTLTFDISMSVALGAFTTEQRDWIGVGLVVEDYRTDTWSGYCCTDIYGVSYICTCYAYYNEGRGSEYDVYNSATKHPLANTATLTLRAANVGSKTQLQFYLSTLKTNIGITSGKQILMELVGYTNAYPDPFQYSDQAIPNDVIACQCYTNLGLLDLRTAVSYDEPKCVRRKPQGNYANYAVTIDISASINHDLTCFFPEFTVPNMASFYAEIKLVTLGSFPYYVTETGADYGGYNKIKTNIVYPNSVATITPGMSVSETPSAYPAAIKYVDDVLSGSYKITVTFASVGSEYTPYIYINLQNGGPVPLHDLCGNNGIFAECRAYTSIVYVIAAKLFIPLSTVDFTKVANLAYPPSRSFRATEFDMLVFVESGGLYTKSGILSRTPSKLNPRPITFNVFPELHGTSKAGYATNIFFTFGINGMNLRAASSGARFEINWTATFTYSPHCRAYVSSTPTASLNCLVKNKQIWITSDTSFTTSYNIYVVLGIVNPTSDIRFTITLYEYERASDLTYAGYTIMQDNTADYSVDNTEGALGKTRLEKSSIRMYPFNTKIIRTTTTGLQPVRFWFNLPITATTPMTWIKVGGGGRFRIDYAQSTYSPYQQCYFRQYDSWTNLIQQTQSRLLYSECVSSTGVITMNVPKPYSMTSSKWYEMVVLPLSTTNNINSGYSNIQEEIRITAYQISPTVFSAQTIQTRRQYEGTSRITLIRAYILTVQPVKTTSVQIEFQLSGGLSNNFPDHWLEFLFYDLTMLSFAPTYTYASELPCVLSTNLPSATTRTYKAKCVLNQFENFVPIIKIKVENLGPLSSATYTLAIDDFQLLDVSALQQPSRRFDLGITYVNLPSSIYYEAFFPQAFVTDGHNVTGSVGSTVSFNNPVQIQYGASAVGSIAFTYPFATTAVGLYNDYKMTIRWKGGYSAIWPAIANLIFGSYSVLWADQINKQVVLMLQSKPVNFAESLSVTNLVNPYVYQKEIYEFINTITLTFFKDFLVDRFRTVSQPPYSTFIRSSSLITMNQTAPSHRLDIYNNLNSFPSGMTTIMNLQVYVAQSYANLLKRQLHRLEVRFTAGIGTIKECWLNDNLWSYYNLMAQCQVSTDGLAINIFGLISTVVTANSGLNILMQSTIISSPVQYVSTVYALNNEIEYTNSYSASMGLLNTSRTLTSFQQYPQQKYLSNYYEYQVRRLEVGHTTPVLKIRLKNPALLTYGSDFMNIYTVSDVDAAAYQNNINLTNMVCTYLPVLSEYHQYGIGTFSPCYKNTLTAPISFTIPAPHGDLAANYDVLLQIRENNIITTVFPMPTLASRNELVIESAIFPGVVYRDNVVLDVYSSFVFAQIRHTSLTMQELNTLTVQTRVAASQAAVAAPSQLVLSLSYNPIYMQSEQHMGLTALYSSDGLGVFKSGYLHSHNLSPASATATTVVSFGQYSNQYAPVKISLSLQSGYTIGLNQIWKVPLLKNPNYRYGTQSYSLQLKLYTSPNPFPIVLAHYNMINEYYVDTNTSAALGILMTNTNNMIQSSTVNLGITMSSYSVPRWSFVQLKWDNLLFGLLLIPDITTNCNDANYNCYYFPRLNLFQAEKKTLTTTSVLTIGATQLSNDFTTTFGFRWAKIFRTDSIQMLTNPYTVYSDLPASKSLTHFIAHVSPSIVLVQGLTNIKSVGLYRITMTVPRVPAGGAVEILLNPTYFSFPAGQLGYGCTALTNLKSTAEQRVLRCFQDATNSKYVLSGFDALSAVSNTTIVITAYIQIKLYVAAAQQFAVNIYGSLGDLTKKIVMANVGTLSLSSSQAPTSYKSIEQYWETYYASTTVLKKYYELESTVTLRNNLLTNPDAFEFEQPWYRDPLSTQRLIYRSNITYSAVDWMEPIQVENTPALATYTVPVNHILTYDKTLSTEYTLKAATHFSTLANLFNTDLVGTASKFWFRTAKAGAYKQLNYYEVIKEPIARPLTIVNRYTAAGKQTMLEISFTILYDVVQPKDIIQFQFDSHSLLQTMFPIDVEGSPDSLNERLLDCQQPVGVNLVDSQKLTCLLSYGNILVQPQKPAILSIPVTKTIALSTVVTILVANVRNPTNIIVTGLTLRVQRLCRNRRNQYCPVFASRGYYRTTAVSESSLTAGTFAPSSLEVLNTGLTHTFTFTVTAPIAINQAIYIVYPENYNEYMPVTCTAGAHTCYVFPTRNWVTVIATAAIPAGTVTIALSGMNNGIHVSPPSLYFRVLVAHGATGELILINHGDLVTLKRNPVTNTATSMLITPTQTPNIFLRNYMNTVIITLDRLYESRFAKAFYIVAPADVLRWDQDYCNATLTVPTTQRQPYPYRLRCGAITSSVLQVLIPADFPLFDIVYQEYTITVNAKFLLSDFPAGADILYVSPPMSSGIWHAYGSASTTYDSRYFISECTTTIMISQHKVPIIGKATFNTKSFLDRRGRTGDDVIYYMLLKPTSTVPVTQIKFYLPQQFGYPPVDNHDDCKLITHSETDLTTCVETIEAGRTVITIDTAGYDNGARIIQLANTNWSQWFKAPMYPGDFYNMTIEMYGSGGILLEKQTANLSDIWGHYFDIAGLNFVNGLDSSTQEIFDFTFRVGDQEIPPGYIATGTNMSSQIHFIFQNIDGFNSDLGTGLNDNDQLGCFVIAGLQPGPDGIKCRLHVGPTYLDQPYIYITGYRTVYPGTIVTVSVSNIKNLKTGEINTCYAAVMLFYHGINTKAYLYRPISKLMLDKTDLAATTFTTSSVTYPGSNVVLTPTTINITVTPTYNVKTTDYFVVRFPMNTVDPYNEQSIQCANCTVQMYYKSNVVRLYPQSNIAAGTPVSFVLNNFPTSAYAMYNKTLNIEIQGYLDGKQKNSKNVSIQRTVEKCILTQTNVTSVSSLNGGQVNVTYVFSFILNIELPLNGAISILIPSSYGNLLTNNATCSTTMPSGAYCVISSVNRVDLYANNTWLNPLLTYTVTVTGLSNPNSNTNQQFILTSYFDSNIYQDRKICENTIQAPTIMIKSVRKCGFSVSLDFHNTNYLASYNFMISCTDVIRVNSILYIYLHTNYNISNAMNKICTSYEATTLVSPNCTLLFINGTYALRVPIRSAANQISLTVQTMFVNPVAGVYGFSCKFFSDDILFSTTDTYNLSIYNNSYTVSNGSQVALLNLPRSAGSQAFYVFRLPKLNITAEKLTIQFPNNFINKIGSQLDVVAISSSDSNLFSKLNFVNLNQIVENTTNNLNISVKYDTPFTTSPIESIVSIGNLTDFLKTSQSWLYYIVKGVLNPSKYVNETFNIVYSEGETVNTIARWVVKNNLVYYISIPPAYMVIDQLTTSDYDTLVPATYNFVLKANNNILTNRKYAIVILLPMFYNDTFYADINITCSVTLPTLTKHNCTLYGNQLVIETQAASNLSQINITVDKIFNPSNDTWCNTTDIGLLERTYFRVRVIDVLTNQVTMETSSSIDQSTCLEFKTWRTPIQVTYNKIVQSGIISKMHLSITKETNSLRVIPYCNNSGITFEPAIYEFNAYNLTTLTNNLIIRSDVLPGLYWINFTKFESTTKMYFKAPLPVQIQVVRSSFEATIAATLTNYSYVGYPIVVPVVLSTPSATPITLVIQVKEEINGSLLNYSKSYGNYSIQKRSILIEAGVTQVNFTILYYNTTVPPAITLLLSLNSLFPIYHTLKTPILYVSFFRDIRYFGLFTPMKVVVTDYPLSNADDVGKPILNVFLNNETQTVQIAPVIIEMLQKDRGSTWSNLLIYTKEEYTLYYCILEQGYTEPTHYTNLTSMNWKNCREASKVNSHKNASNLVNCIAWINTTKLESNSKYNLFAVAFNSMGYSAISKMTFTTAELSLGAQLKLSLSSIVQPLTIINAIKNTMGINANRIKVITSYLDLQNLTNISRTNAYNYTYTVVIAPDPVDDQPSPIELVRKMVEEQQQMLDRNLSIWNEKSAIPYRLVTMVRPKVATYPQPVRIYFYNATFSVKFWEKARVYAILMEDFNASPITLNFTNLTNKGQRVNKTVAPTSKQIRYAKDMNNTLLNIYRYYSGVSDDNGQATIFFDDLKPGSDYVMYMTASNMLPYDPAILLYDEEVGILRFHTIHNPNLNTRRLDYRSLQSSPILQDLVNLKPELGYAIRKYLEDNREKLSLNR